MSSGGKREAYPIELRQKLVGLAQSGRDLKELSLEFGPSVPAIKNWLKKAAEFNRVVEVVQTPAPALAAELAIGNFDRVTDVGLVNFNETGAVALEVSFASGRMIRLVKPNPPNNYWSVMAKARRLEPAQQQQIAAMAAAKGLNFP